MSGVEVIFCDFNGVPYEDEDPVIIDQELWQCVVACAKSMEITPQEFVVLALENLIDNYHKQNASIV